MEAFLSEALPELLDGAATFNIHTHQGKQDLLGKLSARISAYAAWLPDNWRVVVVLDCDDDQCLLLKQLMEQAAAQAGLLTRSTCGELPWRVVNRIAIEELEAWYFGNWAAVQLAYPRVPGSIPSKASYRQSDAIAGGTWEAFERILKRAGYFSGGLRKVEAAREIGKGFGASACISPSYAVFRNALLEAVN